MESIQVKYKYEPINTAATPTNHSIPIQLEPKWSQFKLSINTSLTTKHTETEKEAETIVLTMKMQIGLQTWEAVASLFPLGAKTEDLQH